MTKNTVKRHIKRLGVAGFIFFTLKGLLWLLIPLFFVKNC